jgi:hypothetical protein
MLLNPAGGLISLKDSEVALEILHHEELSMKRKGLVLFVMTAALLLSSAISSEAQVAGRNGGNGGGRGVVGGGKVVGGRGVFRGSGLGRGFNRGFNTGFNQGFGAFNPGFGFGVGLWEDGGDLAELYRELLNNVPYYALHPPVYYSYPVPRTYGYSPFAYGPWVMTPDVTMSPEPLEIINPHVPSTKSDKPAAPGDTTAAATPHPEPLVIINPYVNSGKVLASSQQ